MIGQNKLKSLIKTLNYNSFPSVLLLVGEEGSGKKTLINEEIIPLLGLESKNITNEVSYEGIGEIYLSPIPYLYLVDMDKLSDKKYNILLKFLEEPPKNCKIVLTTSNLSYIIPTILNRCQIWNMEPYSDNELLNFTNNKDLIKYIRVPGKLLDSSITNKLFDIVELAKNIILKCKNATLSNLLSVSNKIDWDKNDNSKFNASVFNNIFVLKASELFKNKLIDVLQYNMVHEYANSRLIKSSDFEKCLVELKFYGH